MEITTKQKLIHNPTFSISNENENQFCDERIVRKSLFRFLFTQHNW